MAGPHYVTKCLLTNFAGDTNLFELIKATGKIEPRALDRAGAEVGIWTDEIETGIMQELDTDGHRVLRGLFRQSQISLTGQERSIFNQWLFFYLIRVPANLALCRQLFRMGIINRSQEQYMGENRRELITKREFYLAEARERNPALYAEKVSKYGQTAVDNELIARWHTKYFLGDVGEAKDAVGLFHHMLKSGNYRNYLKVVRGMKWTWLRSHHDFIIGDNPFCRCNSRSGAINCILKDEALEIFFPLGRNLCLWMHRRKRRISEVIIDETQTMELNRRQIQNAVAKFWGPTATALSPTGAPMKVSPIS